MHPDWAIATEELTRTFSKPRRRRGRWGLQWWRKPATENESPRQQNCFQGEDSNSFVALDRVTLQVRRGELFGLLGPNGAGKTTLIKILATLLAPTSGRAWVAGWDVVSHPQAIRPYINMVSGGETSGYGILTVRENLWLFARLYGIPTRLAYQRIDRLLAVVGLEDKAHTRISHLSTGQRQKMNFCRGFITDPMVLFLDEPTLGLDVASARTIRSFIREWLHEHPGRTILLTTHYLAEADELCDRLAIIDQGRLLACDSPAALKRLVQRHPRYSLHLTPGANGWAPLRGMSVIHNLEVIPRVGGVEVQLALRDEGAIGPVVQTLLQQGAQIVNLRKLEPSLEDVFLQLVGRRWEGDDPDGVLAAAQPRTPNVP
ncbi:MAG: ABC transporter ATP-binding protein [Thermogemmata sp.]|nr:ABC transporter ATP-binding protein [Thermogemmata sp.]